MLRNKHGGARKKQRDDDKRGGRRKAKIRRRITEQAALQLQLLAWQHYGRPTTGDEEDRFLCELIATTAQQALAQATNDE